MRPDVLARLFQQRSQARLIRFDEQTIASAKPDILEAPLWRRFRTVLSPADDQEFLEKMKLVAQDEDGILRPTVSGVLMATEHPEAFLAAAYVQAVLLSRHRAKCRLSIGCKKRHHRAIGCTDTGSL